MTRPDPLELTQRDDPGVSPVIGVILMVAITVVLASVIGTFALDFGQTTGSSAPRASLAVSVDANGDGGNGTITVSHKGGDGIDWRRTRVVLSSSFGGETRFEPETRPSVLGVGGTATFTTNGSSVDTIDWNGEPSYDDRWTGGSSFERLTSGERITVQFIHTPSQRLIFETTVSVP